jgi:hypothetical protein
LAESVQLFDEVEGLGHLHWKIQISNVLTKFIISDRNGWGESELRGEKWRDMMPALLWLVKFMYNPGEFLRPATEKGAETLVRLLVQCDNGSEMLSLAVRHTGNTELVLGLLNSGTDSEARIRRA